MDQLVFHFLNSLVGKNIVLDWFFKFISVYLMYGIPIFFIIYWFLGSKKSALRAFIAGVLAWEGFANLIGHFYFRVRPIVDFPDREIIFHRPDRSFPSDHAAFLFAVAFSFYLAGEKKISFWLFGIGALISIGRVIVGFHFPTDIVAGWVLGILAAWILWVFRNPLDRYVVNPLINLAKKLRLA